MSSNETKRGDLTPEDLIDAPQNVEARRKQEELWKNTSVDVRQQLHAREAALAHKTRYLQCIHYYHICSFLLLSMNSTRSPFSKLSIDTLCCIADFWFYGRQSHLLRNIVLRQKLQVAPANKLSKFKLFLRPRPLLQFEKDAKEYSVVEVARNGRACICHKGLLSRTGKKLNVEHLEYIFDHVFQMNAKQEELTKIALTPLLDHSFVNGGRSTLLMFGQTGTGKTYTLTACLQSIVHRVSSCCIKEMKVNFYEIHGKKAYDLLSNRACVRLMSDQHDVVHIRGAKTVCITPGKRQNTTPAKQLKEVLEQGLSLRSIEVTERNPISSRSHAICKISTNGGGCITLVDLAGSERNYETIKMTPTMHRESAEINKALGALKDCFRCYHSNSAASKNKSTVAKSTRKLPYRHSMLTRVLKDCFESKEHKTSIIATCSPTTTDLEHTLNTLKHVSLMAAEPANRNKVKQKTVKGNQKINNLSRSRSSSTSTSTSSSGKKKISCMTTGVPLSEKESNASYFGKLVHLWDSHDVQQWLVTVDGGRFAHVVLPKHITGEHLMQLGAKKMTTLFQGTVDDRIARANGEGGAWTIGIDGGLTSSSNLEKLGRQIWKALRNEQQASITGKLGLVP